MILIIEDDKSISKLLELTLKTRDYKVKVANNGLTGLSIFLSEKPELVLLDLGLPDIDGIEVIKQIRSIDHTPIIVISARDSEEKKVKALDADANDYLTKPFMSEELLARIRGCLRRTKIDSNDEFLCNGLKVNFSLHQVFVDDIEIHLTPIEFKILELFINNKGRVLTHSFIQKEIWGYESNDDYQSLRVFILNLRKKLCINDHNYIHTEIGIGYRINL